MGGRRLATGGLLLLGAAVVALLAVQALAPGRGATGGAAGAAASGSGAAGGARATALPGDAAAVRALLEELAASIRSGTHVTMAPRLHPAVLDRYGREACEATLAAGSGDPTYAVAVASVAAPGPWEYTTDGRTTLIPDAWPVTARVTTTGQTATQTLHVAPSGGAIAWFVDCGIPRQ